MAGKTQSRFRQIAWAHLHRVKGSLLLGALCTLGVSAAGLLKPWPLKIILDHVLGGAPLPPALGFLQGMLAQRRVTLLVAAAASMVVIALSQALFSSLQTFISSAVGYRVVYALRREVFTHLQQLSLSFHNRARSGDLLSRIVADTNDLRNIFSDDILDFCSHMLMVIGMFVILFVIDWRVGLIAASTLPFLAYSLFHLFAKTRASSKAQKKHEGQVASRMSEVLTAIPLVQAYAREKHEAAQFDAVTAKTLREGIRIARLKAAAKRSSEIITEVGMAAAVLFAVSPGQRLALVGASGAGKSTIVSLILRLYEPQEGTILIDGVDIRHYRRESLRRQIGLVLQRSILFGATVRENIAYGRPEASLEQIVAAAEVAKADEFIRDLEEGYDTVIGERGATLSGGQQQRIAIARAVIRDAPILILDEPMTGLDVESEAKVREALDRLMAGKTCIMITHDLPSIADADLVLLLEEGRILDRGTHAELLASSGRYRQLYKLSLEQPSALTG